MESFFSTYRVSDLLERMAPNTEAKRSLLPKRQQHHPAHNHRRANHDSERHFFYIAQEYGGQNEREERPGTADRNHHRYFAEIKGIVNTGHPQADRDTGSEKPPKTLPVHLPCLLAFLDVPERQDGYDER